MPEPAVDHREAEQDHGGRDNQIPGNRVKRGASNEPNLPQGLLAHRPHRRCCRTALSFLLRTIYGHRNQNADADRSASTYVRRTGLRGFDYPPCVHMRPVGTLSPDRLLSPEGDIHCPIQERRGGDHDGPSAKLGSERSIVTGTIPRRKDGKSNQRKIAATPVDFFAIQTSNFY